MHPRDEHIQPFAQHFVVVIAPGVARNPSARGIIIAHCGLFGGIRLRRIVVQRYHNQTARAFERQSRIHATLIAQIIHLTRIVRARPTWHTAQVPEKHPPAPRRKDQIPTRVPARKSSVSVSPNPWRYHAINGTVAPQGCFRRARAAYWPLTLISGFVSCYPVSFRWKTSLTPREGRHAATSPGNEDRSANRPSSGLYEDR